jgi:hypothetical protein
MTMTTSPLPAGTFLAAACLHTPLMVTREGREYRLPQTIPYSYKNEQGDVVETQAIVFSIDNGNDAFKGCVLDAHEPCLCAQRIVTAYAPARIIRAGDRPITWRVNGSEAFLIGEEALSSWAIEDLPIGLTEERLSDERSRNFLFAALVETLCQARYRPTGSSSEYCLYVGFGIPNEEISLQGVKPRVAAVLQTLFNRCFTVQRTNTEGELETWNIRLVEVTPFPQSLGSFFAWYYRLDGSAIETDIVRYVSLDFGGGHLHRADIDIIHRPGQKPSIRMTASLLGPGTVAMATALREVIRGDYGVTLELVEARQALVCGYAPINGRRTSVKDSIAEIVRDRAQNLFTTILPTIQQGKNYLGFTGGGSVLLQHHLHAMVSQKRRASDFLFVPAEVASTLNSIGGLSAAYAAAQHARERSAHATARSH